MGYKYEWQITVVAKTTSRSVELLGAAVEVMNEKHDTGYEFAIEGEWNLSTDFQSWRLCEETLLNALVPLLDEGEIAYGRWRGEDSESGYYYATNKKWETYDSCHPMQQEINEAHRAQLKD